MSRKRSAPRPVLAEATAGPVVSARMAGLRYVTDDGPGIGRRRAGKGFSYPGPDGRPVRDREKLRRIKALAIPPAWTGVWICPSPDGHLQATGRDTKGRKQYRYHARWRAARDETKYGRMLAFGQALPRVRARVDEDLGRPGLPRERVLATVVRLLETTLIRIGNEEYARANRSFGLTTLRNRHVAVEGATLRFEFRGKSGKHHTVDISDRRLARIVRKCQELPGHELFQYLDDEGRGQAVASDEVNDYLREASGQDFTAKDFRTWAGTVLAALALRECESCESESEAQKMVAQAIVRVAERLGNTPEVCRKCYVHPAVIDAYLDGSLRGALPPGADSEIDFDELTLEEAAVLKMLARRQE